jgi:aspartyl-tRNA(Asn)/glutamyl-tRNA(Gln) amidotransferase subunit A
MQEWLTTTAADLGRGIARGQIDPVALTQTYLQAIADHPHRDRIYTVVTADRALTEAHGARERANAGQRLSLLDGVPISWKDLFDSAAVATEAGTKLLAGRVPDHDAVVLQRATAAGLVCLGKTHMSELAFSGLGYNPQTATPPCVNDLDAVPGGSSSGAAASVAFGLAAAGIGSDTGGSVRIPSAWNDLVGLKTTSGQLTNEGVVPLCGKFDTIGPLTRSVEDAAILLAVMGSAPVADLQGASLEGMRIARLRNVAEEGLREIPGAAYEAALERLAQAGAEIVDFDWPALSDAMALSGVLYTAEAYGLWRDVIEKAPQKMFGEILERFRQGNAFSGADYVAAWAKLAELRADWAQATAGFDAVATATAPILPPNLNRLATDKDYYVTENLLALRNTRIGNLMGLCGVSLPTGTPSCGLQLLGAANDDLRLVRLAAAAENALT